MWLSLIGFMCSGKSSVAAALSRRALVEAVELDADIEAGAGRSVAEIFAVAGEEGFREREVAALEALPADDEIVVSSGGGVVERPSNRSLLRARGVVVWLDAPWEVLLDRLAGTDPSRRPLLKEGRWDQVRDLYRRRRVLYARTAHFRLRCDRASPEVLAGRVWKRRLDWLRLATEAADSPGGGA